MSSDLNLLYTDVEDSLRSTVRDLLSSRCPSDAVIAIHDGDRSVVSPLWRALAVDLGLAGLLVPESLGGAGASAREAAVVLEELGRAAAPVPFLTGAVVATAVLSGWPSATSIHVDGHGDPATAAADLLSALAAGERTAALAVPFSASSWSFVPHVVVDGDGALTGRVTSVAGALEADVLLVPVAVPDGAAAEAAGSGVAPGGVEIRAVEVAAADVAPVTSLDMSRQLADASFDGAASQVVVPAGSGEAAVRRTLDLGAALMASEQLGVAQWCLDTTIDYLKERRQFGRVVGGFQALKHRLADLYTLVEQARAVARYAAATAAEGDPDAQIAASVAQAYCSDVAVKAAEECVQLHGGIGMTWEHPAHLYLKRAKADQIALGTPGAHRARLGELVDLPA
ncbi:MAG TPA: acyl-CoA dehydrogenase family protein [Nocardioidaceae bacterium]|nr:acyl-CoA dehydrogenase family protein [Nocardioidaceae bacterium]